MDETKLKKIVSDELKNQKDFYVQQAKAWISEIGPEPKSKELSDPKHSMSIFQLRSMENILTEYYNTPADLEFYKGCAHNYTSDRYFCKFETRLEREIKELEEQLAKKRKMLKK